jgi:hypothetical protein
MGPCGHRAHEMWALFQPKSKPFRAGAWTQSLKPYDLYVSGERALMENIDPHNEAVAVSIRTEDPEPGRGTYGNIGGQHTYTHTYTAALRAAELGSYSGRRATCANQSNPAVIPHGASVSTNAGLRRSYEWAIVQKTWP